MDRREAARLAQQMDLSKPTDRRIVEVVDTDPDTLVIIEPVEELVVTVKEKKEHFSWTTMDTVITRRKGLHWFSAIVKKPGEDHVRTPWTLVVESVTCASGPKQGCSFCLGEYKDVEVSEEERAANRENIKRIATEVMVRMGIW